MGIHSSPYGSILDIHASPHKAYKISYGKLRWEGLDILVGQIDVHAECAGALDQRLTNGNARSSRRANHGSSLTGCQFAGPFNLITFTSRQLILPPEYIDAINAEPNLSFNAFIREENLSDYQTFRTMRTPPPGMFEEMTMKGLTRALRKLQQYHCRFE